MIPSLPFIDLSCVCLTVFYLTVRCSVPNLFLDLFHVSFYVCRFGPVIQLRVHSFDCFMMAKWGRRVPYREGNPNKRPVSLACCPRDLSSWRCLLHPLYPQDSTRRFSQPEKKNWIVWSCDKSSQNISGRNCICLGFISGFR